MPTGPPTEFFSFTTTEYEALGVNPEMATAVAQPADPGQRIELTPLAGAGATALDVIETVTDAAGRKSEFVELTVLMLTVQAPGAVIWTTP